MAHSLLSPPFLLPLPVWLCILNRTRIPTVPVIYSRTYIISRGVPSVTNDSRLAADIIVNNDLSDLPDAVCFCPGWYWDVLTVKKGEYFGFAL